MNAWINVLTLSSLVMLFSGCGDSIPECDSKEAKQLVKQIEKRYWENVLLGNLNREKILNDIERMSLENITTDNINKDLKISICSGDGIVNGENYTGRLKYKLSVTSDGKLYAELKK